LARHPSDALGDAKPGTLAISLEIAAVDPLT
jgi:hypothetical protein